MLLLDPEPALLPSRIQMAFTLATHVLLVPLGVSMPAITLLMEGIGLRRKDPVALKLARRWSVVMAVQFAVGAVTGTILSFEFGILWPGLLGRYGAAFGLGFAIEGWAFFLEAVFIGIYLYGWNRLRPRTHFLVGLVLPPTGLLGAFAVLAANSWMNTPGGATVQNGRVVDVDVMAALFTRALGYEFWHFTSALYLTAGFVIASVYAVAWLRGRRDHYQRLAFGVPFAVAALMTPVQLVTGDLSARALVTDQPAKFAAMEISWETRDHNPEVIGGVIDDSGQIHLGIPIPALDSILVGYSPDAVVPGLSKFAAANRPSIVEVNITHLAFDVMVGLGSVGFLLALWFAWGMWRRRAPPESRWFYRLASLAGVGAYIAVEAGWITTEVGRQPWIVYNTMRVADAVTDAPASFVWTMLATLVVVYALIAVFFVVLLRRLSARWKREDAGAAASEVGVPYGPRPAAFEADA
ncbi:MAG TPA: cytochrome ubiquinol oxidase subunit I [Candidatus Dormibacteraeota bacterium]|nr:cytochrome ubiquinol oxidase subunit I [Candidatus Dormibacteraeota bacterium]